MKERKRKEKNEDYEQGKSEKKHLIIKTKHAQKSGNQKKNDISVKGNGNQTKNIQIENKNN